MPWVRLVELGLDYFEYFEFVNCFERSKCSLYSLPELCTLLPCFINSLRHARSSTRPDPSATSETSCKMILVVFPAPDRSLRLCTFSVRYMPPYMTVSR